MYALFGVAGMIGVLVCAILFFIAMIRKKPKKKIGAAMLVCASVFIAAGILTPEMTPNERAAYEQRQEEKREQEEAKKEQGEIKNQKSDTEEIETPPSPSVADKPEKTDKCEHNWIEIHRTEPTYESDGESISQCAVCMEEIKTSIPKLEKSVTFDDIYNEYKANELRADELYKNNRYVITGEVNGMETGGLLNWSGGATLTMETRVGNTRVFYYAEFEKEQEEALKTINVGDTITFEGECLGAGSWAECELILE